MHKREPSRKSIDELEKTIGHIFLNKEILREALTHRSYLNENPSWGVPHNERLEYLGDAVLELAVTENLYVQFPNESEGVMTSLRAALVNHIILAVVAREIHLDAFLYLSKGEEKDTGRARDVILANALEALIGSIYLDGGYAPSKQFIDTHIFPHITDVIKTERYKDPKSVLQELAQEREKVTPTYRVLREHGPDHDRTFEVGVYFDDAHIAEGVGRSKQEAEIDAAKKALAQYNTSE